jgi:hypothetical protein
MPREHVAIQHIPKPLSILELPAVYIQLSCTQVAQNQTGHNLGDLGGNAELSTKILFCL